MGALRKAAIGLGLVVVLAAAPVLWIETSCQRPRVTVDATPALLPPEERRALVDTWLTYPEWSIVHAYEDFAQVGRARGEAAFDYVGSITGYWRSLCSLSGVASARGDIATDMRAMLHVIGLSFTAEMAVKGVWETTIGRMAAWWRGPRPTAEDLFAADVNDAYAAFLRQTPWYEFPFGATLLRFWRETSFGDVSLVRSTERRIALSMEYGAKAIYAQVLGLAAGLAPAKLTIRTVVAGLDEQDALADPRIRVVERRADGLSVIETPRYRAFTEVLLGLAERQRGVVEIAGNREIFVTVIAPAGNPALAETDLVLRVPIQSRPGFERLGLTVGVRTLPGLLTRTRTGPVVLEHVYDY